MRIRGWNRLDCLYHELKKKIKKTSEKEKKKGRSLAVDLFVVGHSL
jgi:hypothetical protein